MTIIQCMKMTSTTLVSLKLSPPSITPQHHPKPYPRPITNPNPNPNPNPDTLQARLLNSLNSGNLRDAIAAVDLMSRRGSHPDPSTFALLLKSCIRSRSFALGELVHAQMLRSPVEPDAVTLNSLLSLYSKSGKWEAAEEIFDAMGEKRNLVSWASMVSCYANNGLESEAVRAFVGMVERGFRPNEFCFSAAVRACSKMADSRIGSSVFGFSIKTGCFRSDVCVGCALMDMFAKGFDDLDNAYKVFDKIPQRTAVAWTLMITRLAQAGRSLEAIELFQHMVSNDEFVPDRFTFSGALSACAETALLPLGEQLHSQIIRSGLHPDRCIGSCLVDMYAKCGSIEKSRKVFDQMPERNLLSWTAMINSYVQIGGHNRLAIELFRDMVEWGQVPPNCFTLSTVLKAISNLSDPNIGKQVHSIAIKLELSSQSYVGDSLVHMYSKFGLIGDSHKAFEALIDKTEVSYATIIDAYIKRFDFKRALELLRESNEHSEFSLSTLLTGAASVGSICLGSQLHSRAVKSGLDSHLRVVNALISMYSKCRDVEAGFRVFRETRNRNVVTWTAMIDGFSKHGLKERALQVFDQMIGSGSVPNEVTHKAVLSALGQSESLGFVNSNMPHPSDSLSWQNFEGSIQSRGECAAGAILERDPKDSDQGEVLLLKRPRQFTGGRGSTRDRG